MISFRRFGTAKRLKQVWDLREGFFNKIIYKDWKLLLANIIYLDVWQCQTYESLTQYILTFGSAKPTGAFHAI